ncbi:MAG: DUF2993 domain-containing protein [Acidipropionibacterium jensenii]|uniref:LmeA family phospholipid-binding protein n=1 Tax=Acidipropionibacterium jensenii TaxID=1749 RepID=UPI002648DA18|nr:DUF2993 domain-containing protein [Acidipropionibacterium jensenii]MDN6441529.1 DUF2993 domain-containing protein [Acidipropionibacterium jensenii]
MTSQPEGPGADPYRRPGMDEPTRVLPDPLGSPDPLDPTDPRTLVDPDGVPTRSRGRRDPAGASGSGGGARRVIRRLATVLLVVLLIVAAVLADAVARQRTEQHVAQQIATQLDTRQEDVDVTIGGWPFLAVLATDRLSSVDLSIPVATVTRQDRRVTFRDVAVHASGVRNARHLDRGIIDQAEASARLDWAQLSQLSGAAITSAGNSRVQVVRKVDVLGAQVDVQVSAVPGINPADRTVTFSDPKASVDGITIPASLLGPAMSSISKKMVLPDLGSMRYQSLTVDSRGAKVSMAGSQVELKDLLAS